MVDHRISWTRTLGKASGVTLIAHFSCPRRTQHPVRQRRTLMDCGVFEFAVHWADQGSNSTAQCAHNRDWVGAGHRSNHNAMWGPPAPPKAYRYARRRHPVPHEMTTLSTRSSSRGQLSTISRFTVSSFSLVLRQIGTIHSPRSPGPRVRDQVAPAISDSDSVDGDGDGDGDGVIVIAR